MNNSQASSPPCEFQQIMLQDLPLDVRVEREGQRLVDAADDPNAGLEILGAFEDDLVDDSYAIMRRYNRDKAAEVIARTLHQTAFAAMSCEVYVELLRRITPKLEAYLHVLQIGMCW